MTLQLQLAGQITAGPDAQTDNLFPSGVNNLNFGLTPSNKPYVVSAGNVVQLASPAAFAAIAGIGATSTVTQAHTLFCRTVNQMLLQLTFANPAGGGDIIITQPILGVMLAEFPSNGYLKGLAVQGTGQFEFAAYGNQ